MNWKQLLCARRERSHTTSNPNDVRTEFRKDYHRIIGSASFRRLQDKAQVYPLLRGDFVRTRLTHSLEVSDFAGSLCDTIFRRLIENNTPDIDDTVRENCCDILECAGLVHDIGNPPFGHFGEFAIRNWFEENFPKLLYKGTPVCDLLDEQMKADFLDFEGNAQALRVLTRLHTLMDIETGMNLTYALLNTIVKYPVSSLQIDKNSGDIRTKKMGFYRSEQALFEQISESTGAVGCRYPLTFILESADDIAYKTADIEDAVIKGLLNYEQLLSELRNEKFLKECKNDGERKALEDAAAELEHALDSAGKLNMRDPRSKAVQRWIVKQQNTMIYAAADAFCDNYKAIMDGEFKDELLGISRARVLAKALSDIAYRYAFRSPLIVKSELSENAVMNYLLDKIVTAALRFDTDDGNMYDRDLTEVLSENYLQICRKSCEDKSDAEQAYARLLFACDCVCGMTDSYASDFFRKLSGFEG